MSLDSVGKAFTANRRTRRISNFVIASGLIDTYNWIKGAYIRLYNPSLIIRGPILTHEHCDQKCQTCW